MLTILLSIAIISAAGAACYIATIWRSIRLAETKESSDVAWRLEVLKHEQIVALDTVQFQHTQEAAEYAHECELEAYKQRVEVEDELNRRNLQHYTALGGAGAADTDEPADAKGREFSVTDWRDPS